MLKVCFELRSCIVGSTANEFIIIAFCYERAGLVAVLRFLITIMIVFSAHKYFIDFF